MFACKNVLMANVLACCIVYYYVVCRYINIILLLQITSMLISPELNTFSVVSC